MPGCQKGPQLAALVPAAAWPRRGKVARRNGKEVLQRGEGKGRGAHLGVQNPVIAVSKS